MGITGLKPLLKKQYPDSFFNCQNDTVPKPKNISYILQDPMTSLYRLRPKYGFSSSSSDGTTFTGVHLYQSLMDAHHKFFEDNSALAKLSIVSADKPKYKPVYKIMTTRERVTRFLKGTDARGKPNTFYSKDCEIGDKGICVDGQWEEIDLGRLMNSRHLRSKMWAFIRKKAITDEWCMGTNLILDVSEDRGPLHITDWGVHGETKDYKSEYGEGDLSMIYWLKYVLRQPDSAGHNILLYTTDGDLLPMFMFHTWDTDFHGTQVYWQDFDNSYVHLNTLQASLKADNWTAARFMSFCIISGCDFFQKKWTTHNIGHDKMWQAMRTVNARGDCNQQSMEEWDDFVQVILNMYFYAYEARLPHVVRCSDLETVRNSFANARGRRPVLPLSVTEWFYPFEWYRWMFSYWAELDPNVRRISDAALKFAGIKGMTAVHTKPIQDETVV
jgi:hypothetical protein